jgi:hypothetical protein
MDLIYNHLINNAIITASLMLVVAIITAFVFLFKIDNLMDERNTEYDGLGCGLYILLPILFFALCCLFSNKSGDIWRPKLKEVLCIMIVFFFFILSPAIATTITLYFDYNYYNDFKACSSYNYVNSTSCGFVTDLKCYGSRDYFVSAAKCNHENDCACTTSTDCIYFTRVTHDDEYNIRRKSTLDCSAFTSTIPQYLFIILVLTIIIVSLLLFLCLLSGPQQYFISLAHPSYALPPSDVHDDRHENGDNETL